MSTNPKIEKLLERYSPERRETMRKILLGTAIYAAPVIASYSMQNLGGVANAQSGNVGSFAVPVDSGLGLAAAAGAVAAAGAFVLRRRRRKDQDEDKS
jgi:LPXTG-motif cell wall-anchored protein